MKKNSIKQTLPKLIRIMIILLLILIIPVHIWQQLYMRHQSQRESSREVFGQLEQVIETNERDVERAKEEYSETCIQSAEMVAYFLQNNPSVPDSLEESRKLAEKLNVDEIHFFTPEGEIYAGTHPEYYGYTFRSGEQMSFFLPMLEDKALKLCQEVTPNTAEGKEMQYAAVWTEDGSQIVQIGMEPKRLLKLMQEKTLEHVVSTFPFDFSGYLHVLDLESNEIVATTSSKLLGKNFSEKFDSHSETFNEKIEDTHYIYNGKRYCVYVEKFKGYLLIRTYLSSFLLKEILVSTAMLLVYIGVVAIVVLGIIGWYVRKRVSDNLTHIVDELKKIESGDLENITIQTGIIEFDKLIFYINQLLKTIRLSWTKMSNVFDKSGLPIGIFEYSHFYKKYLINERLLEILGIQEKEASEAQADLVQKILLDIEKHQVNEEVIYEYSRQNERIYLRMKKIVDELSVTYYVTDVSQWWNEVSDLKKESSRDALTLLYNRRGFHEKMEAIFLRSQELGHAVLVMIDADGLKTINDVYGHLIGDEYLKRIGKMFEMTSEEHMVSARLGGDEFVVFFYGYSTREELEYELEQLKAKRGERLFNEKEKINATIEFSAGYAFYQEDGQDYHTLMQVADQRMYMEKSSRKQQLQNSR